MKFGLNSVDLSRRSQGVNTPTAPTRCRYLDQQFQTTCCFLYWIRSIVHLVLTPWDLLDRSTELRPNFTWVSSFNLKIFTIMFQNLIHAENTLMKFSTVPFTLSFDEKHRSVHSYPNRLRVPHDCSFQTFNPLLLLIRISSCI